MSTKIYELHHVPSDETFLYLVGDSGTLWSYTSNIKWERVLFAFRTIDQLLDLVQRDPDRYEITEFEMKGQWKNHD